MSHKYYVLILLIAGLWTSVNGDYFEECDGEENTYIAVQEDCSYYILCHGEDSYRDSCPEDSPYFSLEEQTCDMDRNVCGDRPFPNGEFESGEVVESTEESTNSPTQSSSSVSVAVSTTTAGLTTTTTTSPTSVIIPTSTTSLVTTAPQIITTPNHITPHLPSFCPAVDNPNKAIFLPHPKSCTEYFLCYHGERLPMHCSNMLHFDARQQKCDYPEKVKCQIMDVVSPREQCLAHTIDYYPHPVNCNYYYQCLLGYLKVMQCPLNMGWHYEKRTCVLRSQAKCYSSSNRF
ncbi:hypothetical protein FF38_13213 [Lucilia cuprina]|uniref:Chitin-binding type-2 domain-containing protein n=1 Tax=Lucilia cuprina TaxID=7375 RepID=A0A0L0CK87_LUCCU|nr:hypothetical protein FF38_13213 [Lucilia cuprina]